MTSSRPPPKKSEIARPHQGVAAARKKNSGRGCCGCLTVARHERFANSSRPIGPVGTPPDPHRRVAHGAGLPRMAVGERYLGSSARTRAGKGSGSRTPRLNVWSRTSLCVVEVERARACMMRCCCEARRKSTTHRRISPGFLFVYMKNNREFLERRKSDRKHQRSVTISTWACKK